MTNYVCNRPLITRVDHNKKLIVFHHNIASSIFMLENTRTYMKSTLRQTICTNSTVSECKLLFLFAN